MQGKLKGAQLLMFERQTQRTLSSESRIICPLAEMRVSSNFNEMVDQRHESRSTAQIIDVDGVCKQNLLICCATTQRDAKIFREI
jgi:hypothetical protein